MMRCFLYDNYVEFLHGYEEISVLVIGRLKGIHMRTHAHMIVVNNVF